MEGLQEAAVTVELRLKIDQNHVDLKGGLVTVDNTFSWTFHLWVWYYFMNIIHLFRSFRDYGEAVLKHLENLVDSDPKLIKAPVNYEGVRSLSSPTYQWVFSINVVDLYSSIYNWYFIGLFSVHVFLNLSVWLHYYQVLFCSCQNVCWLHIDWARIAAYTK